MDDVIQSKTFSFQKLYDSFERLQFNMTTNKFEGREEVPTIAFLDSYKEVSNLFEFLGAAFYFVKSDVDSKISILENLYREDEQKFCTLQNMVVYEVENRLTMTPPRKSGSRTLLRLLRALVFFSLFLLKIKEGCSLSLTSNCDGRRRKSDILNEIDNNEENRCAYPHSEDTKRKNFERHELRDCARQAYEESLAKYHTWTVRKAAGLAFYTLPSRQYFLDHIGLSNESKLEEKLGILISAVEKVTENLQKLYDDYHLNQLP